MVRFGIVTFGKSSWRRQTGVQQYSDTSPFSIPWLQSRLLKFTAE